MVLDSRRNKKLEKSIGCLNPCVGEDGLIRVSGRLEQSNHDDKLMYPVIFPKKRKLTEMIIRQCHQKDTYSRRKVTLNEIYWLIQSNSEVKKVTSRCVTCRRLRRTVGKQIMADLPQDRLKKKPPFTYYGVDMFSPLEINERRNTLKRYEALFTCLASRAFQTEMTNIMDTHSSLYCSLSLLEW